MTMSLTMSDLTESSAAERQVEEEDDTEYY